MLDFGALPPEINSALMYSGPGSAGMSAAASAWNALAGELASAATGYEQVITGLTTEEWLGPASAAMAAAAKPYVAWTADAAQKAEQSGNLVRAGAAAYEKAFAAMVPPPAIAANRLQHAQLVATNAFGQNTSLIAQLEAQYGQMWAQDAGAMYTYAGESASAANVPPFTTPAPIADPTALTAANQAAPAAGTTGNLLTAVQNALKGLAAPLSGDSSTTSSAGGLLQLLTGSSTLPTSLPSALNEWSPYAGFLYNTEGLPYFSVGMGNNFVQMAKTLGLIGQAAPAATNAAGAAGAAGAAATGLPGAGLGGAGGALGAAAAPVGTMGGASFAGKLAVPSTWIGSGPPAPVGPLPPVPVSTVVAPEVGAGAGNLLGGMPLAGAGAGSSGPSGPRYGFKPTVMPNSPFAG